MEDIFPYRIPEISVHIDYNKLNSREYILCNSKHRHYLKINLDTYNLLSLVNGERNLSTICDLFNARFNKDMKVDFLEKFLYEKMSIYGVLKGEDDRIKPYMKPDYLKLSFIIFNDRLLSKIVKYFKFLFNIKIVFVTLFLCLSIIISMTILRIDAFQSINIQKSLVYFFIVIASSATFHEIGHATAASYFGAEHGGIGGGFYLLSPVYFADVTDIWRLKKWQRVAVNLSGMYFELIFCTLLVIVGFLIDSFLLTVISLTVCVHTLFNLNPFLRSDGYWIISDLSNRPNLLQHSFQRVKDVFRFLIGKKVIWRLSDFFLFLYGLVSYGFIALFLYYVLFRNPNSILNFPVNFVEFVKSIFNHSSEISLVKYGQLIIPIIFFYLVFSVFKGVGKRVFDKIRKTYPVRT